MLSNNLKELRKSKGMTQDEFAIKLNVVRQTVSKWERGLSVPDSEMLVQISNVFEVPVSTLLGENIELRDDQNEVKVLSEKLALVNEKLAKKAEIQRKIIRSFSCLGFLLCLCIIIFEVFEKFYYKSIGVIGGADGPTAIYLTQNNVAVVNVIIVIIVMLISVFGIYFTRRNK